MTTTLFAALIVGHLIGDFIIQHHTWSSHKADPGWAGWGWCSLHAATYGAACWAVLALAVAVEGFDVSGPAVAIIMVVNAGLHGFLDRRWPLEWIIRATGSGPWLDKDPRAMFIFDQAVHVICLYAAAIAITIAS